MTGYKGEGEMRGRWEGISLHICPSVLQINCIICTLLPQNCGLYSMWFDDVLGEPLTFQLHAVHSTLSTACPVDDVFVVGSRATVVMFWLAPPTGVTMSAVQLVMSSET